MSKRLTISFGSDEELYDDVENLLDDVEEDGKSASARAVFRAVVEAADDADKPPCEAILDGSDAGEVDYDYRDKLESTLSSEAVLEIVKTEDRPVINPVHIPTDVESEVKSTRRKVDICTAVLRYNSLDNVYRDLSDQHPADANEEARYVDRAGAAVAVEQTLGTGRDDYYLDVQKADIPGRVLDRFVKLPKMSRYDVANRSSGRSGLCAVEAHREWIGCASNLKGMDIEDLSDRHLRDVVSDCDDLIDVSDQIAVSLGDSDAIDDVVEQLKGVRDEAILEYRSRDTDSGSSWT